jgi:tetratricopeptide (TPR) repeat protein
MIAGALLLLAATGQVEDPCQAIPPEPPGSAVSTDDAGRYAAVGDKERELGDQRTAAIAYRRALELNPRHAQARAGLSAVCRTPPPIGNDGGADADAGKVRGENHFDRALVAYQAGDWDSARHGFTESLRDPDLAAAASFFLGMMAYRQGDGRTAMQAFDRAADDPEYRSFARPPRRLAARNRRLALMLLVQSEYDSNVKLLPTTPPPVSSLGPPVADLSLMGVAAAAIRLLPALALHNTLLARRQVELREHDLVIENPSLALQSYRGRHQGGVRLEIDWQWLHGLLYQQAQQGALEYRYLSTGGYGLRTGYVLRRRTFDQVRADFDGYVHTAALEGGRGWRGGVSALSGFYGVHEQTARRELAHSGLGAQLAFAWQGRFVQLGASARVLGARYQAPDALGVRRRDVRGEGNLDLEFSLHDQLALTAGGDAALNFSSVQDFDYRKLVVRVGLAGYLGLL